MVNNETHPFAGRRTRVLGMEEVRRLLDLPEALELQRAAFVAHAAGRTVEAPNAWLRLPEGGRRGWLKLLAGYDATTGALGVKILARFPDNPSGANLGSLVLLFDDESGFPLAVMDGVYITAVRTGAGAGLASQVLAPSSVETVGVIGTGVVAWYSVRAMVLARRDVRRVRVFSRSPERRKRFAERLERETGLEAEPAETVDEAVRDVDIVVTATNASSPVLLPEHVRAGQLVNAMGIRTEVAPETIARCLVVPDGQREAMNEGKFSVALSAGVVREEDLGPELGAVLSGLIPPPTRDRPILFDSSGVAVQDVVAARRVWERAEREGIGLVVDLGLSSSLWD